MIPTIPYLRRRRAIFRKSRDDADGLYPTHERRLTIMANASDLSPSMSDVHLPVAPNHGGNRMETTSLSSIGGHPMQGITASRTLRDHYEQTAPERRASMNQLNESRGAAIFGGHVGLPVAALHYYHHDDPGRPGLAIITPSVHARLGAAGMAASAARGEPFDSAAASLHARMYYHSMADRHIYAPPVHELARQMIARHPESEHAGVALGNIIMPVRLGDLARGNRHLLEKTDRGGVTGFGTAFDREDYIHKITRPDPPDEEQGFGVTSHPPPVHLWTAHPGTGTPDARAFLLQVPHAAINDQQEDWHRRMSQKGGLSFDAPIPLHRVTDVTGQMNRWATDSHHDFAHHHFAPRHYGGSDED